MTSSRVPSTVSVIARAMRAMEPEACSEPTRPRTVLAATLSLALKVFSKGMRSGTTLANSTGSSGMSRWKRIQSASGAQERYWTYTPSTFSARKRDMAASSPARS